MHVDHLTLVLIANTNRAATFKEDALNSRARNNLKEFPRFLAAPR